MRERGRGRRWLLEKAGYAFDIMPANIDEPIDAEHGSCRQYVQHVCWLKAAAVAPRVADGVVLAADSVGWLDDRVIGNPKHFAQNPRKIIHVDIDPSSISKRVKVDVPIVGDVKEVLNDLLAQIEASRPMQAPASTEAW